MDFLKHQTRGSSKYKKLTAETDADKENVKKQSNEKLRNRKPLVDVSSNVAPVSNKKYDTNATKAQNTTEIKTKLKYNKLKDEENKIELKTLVTLKSVPFVLSPITSNSCCGNEILLSQGIPSNIKYRRTRRNHRTLREADSTFSHYEDEYLDEIITYLLKTEKIFLITKIKVPQEIRGVIVNWLMRMQEYLQLPVNILFTTVRIFDIICTKIRIPLNMYQLIGMTCLWIANKYEDFRTCVVARDLLNLCKNIYTTEQLLKMEKKILLLLNFSLNFPDITAYIANFLRGCIDDNNNLLYHCCLYVMECYTLHEHYSVTTPSIISAAALYLTLKLICPLHFNNCWTNLNNTKGFYDIDKIENTVSKMTKQIEKVQDCKYPHRQAYEKYSDKRYNQVSVIFLDSSSC